MQMSAVDGGMDAANGVVWKCVTIYVGSTIETYSCLVGGAGVASSADAVADAGVADAGVAPSAVASAGVRAEQTHVADAGVVPSAFADTGVASSVVADTVVASSVVGTSRSTSLVAELALRPL